MTRVNPAEGSHNVADRDGFPIERVWAEAHPERFELHLRAEGKRPVVPALSGAASWRPVASGTPLARVFRQFFERT